MVQQIEIALKPKRRGFHDDFRSATTGDACHCKNVSDELQIEYYD